MLGREQKRGQIWKGRRWGEKETSLIILSPSPFFIWFCSRSNFRAITPLETLTTPANEAQDLATSNDNRLMIYQEPFVMGSSWIHFVTIQMPPFVVKRKMYRSCKLLLEEIPNCYLKRFQLNDWPDWTVIQSSLLWTDGTTPQLVLH